MTGAQRTRLKGMAAGVALVAGVLLMVHAWPSDHHAARPAAVVLSTSTSSVSSTTAADELQRAIDAFQAANANDHSEPYGPADGVHRDPQGGRWVEVNRDASCAWSIVDYGAGEVVDQGKGYVVEVPAQVAAFRTEPRCSWAYLAQR